MAYILIDSNVVVYTFDQNDPRRQGRSIEVLSRLAAAGIGLLSVQCLAEFASVGLRRLRPPLTAAETVTHVERLARTFRVLDLTTSIVITAVRGVRDHKLSYYDAQLWATALLNQIPVIFSEDFDHDTTREGVRFINPFAPGFDLSLWA